MATITVGTNSWVTLAYADDYFAEQYSYSDWAAILENSRKLLLIQAYRWINQQTDLSIPTTSTNILVKQAQCLVAWYIYKHYENHEKRRALYTQGVTRFQISKFSESLKGAEFPEWIKDMLDDFLTDIGGQFPIIEREFENNNTA